MPKASGIRDYLAIGVSAVALLAWSAPALADSIQWRTGACEVRAQTPGDIEAALQSLADRSASSRRIVVQFDRPVDDALRAELAAHGLRLLNYVGDNAFFASLSTKRADASELSITTGLVGVDEIQTEWKLHPAFDVGATPAWASATSADGTPIAAAYILFHRDVDLLTEGIGVATAYGADVRSVLESVNGLVIELPEDLIRPLAGEDVVQWIEPPLPPMGPVNAENRARTQADIVQAPPYNLDGAGVTVMVYDGGTARATHVDFEGRLTVCDSGNSSDHATHVSGTIGGAGVADPTYTGMAPGVTLLSYAFEPEGGSEEGSLYGDPGDIEDDYSEAINTYGADIANNSIGSNVAYNGLPCEWEGNYGVTAQLIDTIVRGDGSNPLFAEPFRVVWAAGNERYWGRCGLEYHTTAPPANAKNHITVGGLNAEDDSMTDFSGWGPTDDGRLKPDLCAPGANVTSCDGGGDTAYSTKSGTSMACPTVSGISALLMEDYRAQFPAAPDMRNSTLKSLLAHTAVDLGNAGPDYQFGYGSVRIQDAVDFMRTQNFLEAQVSLGGVHEVLVAVEPGDTELKVTLAWDDYPATPNVSPALVNDLDLRVYSPTAVRHYPWTLAGVQYPHWPAVQTEENHVDNIEQVLVDSPEPGVWTIEVHGHNVPEGPQAFSLCLSPQINHCSSQGTIVLHRPAYSCFSVATIRVIDCDLNTDGEAVEEVTVTIESDSEPGGESVLLTEIGPDAADFRGSITLDATNSPGVLQVGHGDTVTATYIDADDGQGGTNVVVEATAPVDCQQAVISNVQVIDITPFSAAVTFDTDEAAVGTVRFGLSCGALTESTTEAGLGTMHTVVLTGLLENTFYKFAVDVVDHVGNLSTNDNGGQCHSFSTLVVIYEFPLDTDPAWSTDGDWEFGQPTGDGGDFFFDCQDPTSGHTGDNVYGYNLWGNYGNSLPAQYLTTPALDCTGYCGVKLGFWRWLALYADDEVSLEVSNNGSDWTILWDYNDSFCDDFFAWQEMVFDISAVADDQPTVYVRWAMGPTDWGIAAAGWNIDDVAIWGSHEPGDFDGDGDVDLDDFNTLAECMLGPALPSPDCDPADLDSDNDVDLADFAAFQTRFTGSGA